jgi:peptidoglycan/LPS O-acetylase OafA/YrhL
MYCVLPYCFALALSAKRLWVMIGAWLLAVGLALVYSLVPMTGRLNVLDFAPCFMPGVIAYYMLRNRIRHSLPALFWPSFIVGILAIFSLFSQKFLWPQWIMCFVIGVSISQFRELGNRQVNSVTHWIAKYSYGIYLGHIFCLWLIFVVGRKLPAWLQWGLIGPAIAITAFVLFHVIEEPMMKFGAKIADERHRRATAAIAAEPFPIGAP